MRNLGVNILTKLFIFSFLSLFMYSSSNSQENMDSREYSVQSGNSLSEIAKKFSVSDINIKTQNGLESDLILTGQKLIILTSTNDSKTMDYQISDTKPNDMPDKNVTSDYTKTEIKPIKEYKGEEEIKEKPKPLLENHVRFDPIFYL